MKWLSEIQGLRTAIMALVLLTEVVCRGLGLDAGPAFTLAHSLFRAVGWDEADAGTLFDPAVVGAAILTIYFAIRRAIAWYSEKGKAA